MERQPSQTNVWPHTRHHAPGDRLPPGGLFSTPN